MEKIKVNEKYEIKLPSNIFEIGDEITFENIDKNTVSIKKVY